MTKMTKIDLFKNCINFIKGDPTNVNSWIASEGKFKQEEVSPAELIEGLNHEIELLQRKASTPRKPTKTQTENESFKATLLAYLENAGTPKTIKEIVSEIEGFSELSNQRVTHLLTALRNEGKVKRTVIKKVPYYEIGTEEKEEG